MQGDVARFVTPDLVLRVAPSRVVRIAFVLDVLSMYSDDCTRDATRFGIPRHVISNFERAYHGCLILRMVALSGADSRAHSNVCLQCGVTQFPNSVFSLSCQMIRPANEFN
jgi:hypothetical protein